MEGLKEKIPPPEEYLPLAAMAWACANPMYPCDSQEQAFDMIKKRWRKRPVSLARHFFSYGWLWRRDNDADSRYLMINAARLLERDHATIHYSYWRVRDLLVMQNANAKMMDVMLDLNRKDVPLKTLLKAAACDPAQIKPLQWLFVKEPTKLRRAQVHELYRKVAACA